MCTHIPNAIYANGSQEEEDEEDEEAVDESSIYICTL